MREREREFLVNFYNLTYPGNANYITVSCFFNVLFNKLAVIFVRNLFLRKKKNWKMYFAIL